jgi:hypothetical protein
MNHGRTLGHRPQAGRLDGIRLHQRLTATGRGAVTKARAAEWVDKNLSTGVGLGTSEPLVPTAWSRARKSSPVATGNPFADMRMMSASLPSERRNLIAMPRTRPVEGWVSGASGTPPALEKRMISGVGAPLRKTAELSASAPCAGYPANRRALAHHVAVRLVPLDGWPWAPGKTYFPK